MDDPTHTYSTVSMGKMQMLAFNSTTGTIYDLSSDHPTLKVRTFRIGWDRAAATKVLFPPCEGTRGTQERSELSSAQLTGNLYAYGSRHQKQSPERRGAWATSRPELQSRIQ